jgi:hypothetical protein
MAKGLKIRNTDINGGLTGKMLSGTRVGSYRSGRTYSTARKFVKAYNPNSADQQVIRGAFRYSVAGWNLLTDAERMLWNESKNVYKNSNKFGGNFRTGRNVYIGANTILNQAGLSYVSTPNPTVATIFDGIDIAVDVSLSAIALTANCSEFLNTEKIIVKASKKLTSGASVGKPVYITNYNVAGNIDENFWAQYVAKYGTPVVGDNIQFEVVLVGLGGNTRIVYLSTVPVLA